jgi:hypothetical protein
MVNMLEVIELRSVKKDKPQILELIDKLSGDDIKKTDMTIKIFTHSIIETDYSIHLYYKTSSHENFGSELGYELTSYLKDYGLVSHNIWIDRNL